MLEAEVDSLPFLTGRSISVPTRSGHRDFSSDWIAPEVSDGAAEAEDGEALVVDGVVEVAQRLDAAGLGVEDLGVGAELLAVSVGDDVDVLLGLDDRQLGDRDAAAGLLEVEPSGADLKRDVGGGVVACLVRRSSCCWIAAARRRVAPLSVIVQSA